MRSILKDKKTVYISQVLPPIPKKDDDGNLTGETISVYDEPVKLRLNVQPITDVVEMQAFGADVSNVLRAEFTPYDVRGFDIQEHQVAWIGVLPNGNLQNDDIAKPMNNNYVVKQVLPTGGQYSVYFEKVTGATKA